MTSRAMFRAPRAMDSSDGGLARRTMMTRMQMQWERWMIARVGSRRARYARGA